MNNRRKLLFALGAGAIAKPFASFAQHQGKVWRVGYVTSRSRPASLDDDIYGAFVSAMRELGYIEGKNIVMEWGFADGINERLPGLVADFLRLKVDVIVAVSAPAIRAAQRVTAMIPIVMTAVTDPVGQGMVASLAKPGKNTSGISNMSSDVSIKSVEFLRAVVPKLARVALLLNPSTPSAPLVLKEVQAAAKPAGISVSVFEAGNPSQIDAAFAAIAGARPGALIVATDIYFPSRMRQITELAARHRIPAIYTSNTYVDAGGLMSYGENVAVGQRRTAVYVDKILKGAKPADLPVEQPTKFELVINMKTAKALGLSIPQSLLISAEKVIE